MAIDIGEAAIDRGDASGGGVTWVSKDNPANASGNITSVEIWANSDMSNVKVATFYTTDGNTLSTRDSEAIGSVSAGSKQTFAVDLAVEEGDYIGIYYTPGFIERDSSGYGGVWYLIGDNIPCSQAVFDLAAGRAISLYGSGEEAAVGGRGWCQK